MTWETHLLFLIDLSELEEGKAIGRWILKNADDLSAVQWKNIEIYRHNPNQSSWINKWSCTFNLRIPLIPDWNMLDCTWARQGICCCHRWLERPECACLRSYNGAGHWQHLWLVAGITSGLWLSADSQCGGLAPQLSPTQNKPHKQRDVFSCKNNFMLLKVITKAYFI